MDSCKGTLLKCPRCTSRVKRLDTHQARQHQMDRADIKCLVRIAKGKPIPESEEDASESDHDIQPLKESDEESLSEEAEMEKEGDSVALSSASVDKDVKTFKRWLLSTDGGKHSEKTADMYASYMKFILVTEFDGNPQNLHTFEKMARPDGLIDRLRKDKSATTVNTYLFAFSKIFEILHFKQALHVTEEVPGRHTKNQTVGSLDEERGDRTKTRP